MIKIARLTFNPFGENTYLLIAENSNTIIVDAGCHNDLEYSKLASYIETNNLKPTMTLNTHAHIDHILGVNFVKEKWGVKWGLSPLDSPVLDMAGVSASMYGFELESTPTVDFALNDGDEISLGGDIIKVIATPGHSAGGVCFYIPSSGALIVGDTLFRGSIGRTDLPTGDYDALMSSIAKKLLPLGDDLHVLSGHGDSTTIGEERNKNPFVTEFLTGTTDTITEQ